MTQGFLIGLGVGLVTAWFLYWRIAKLFFRLGMGKESLRRDVFSRFSWEALMKTRDQLEMEIARRHPPYTDGDQFDVETRAESCVVRRP
jgi:hypothetical protein